MLHRIQDRIAAAIGVDVSGRDELVRAMLQPPTGSQIGYWLQLGLSVVIATLGLALGSGAVVIGAMLISPLMQPLVELGMGLATGSLLLAVRAAVRTAGSVVVAVAGSALITWLLPVQEITPELAARTSPNALDLFIAAACALAAVYTTVRKINDTTSAAAGTAIGIALVPPLCTAGFGLGIGNFDVATGAGLLFVANLSAILAIASLVLLCLGYGHLGVAALDDSADSPGTLRRIAIWSRRRISRLGVASRLVPPFLLMAIVFVPLRRALQEVAWEVRARSAINQILSAGPSDVVVQHLNVSGHSVSLRLLLVGSLAEAAAFQRRLHAEMAAATGTDPSVEVIAVPDASTLDSVAAKLAQAQSAVEALAARPRKPPDAAARLAAEWPPAAGRLVRTTIQVDPAGTRIRAIHLGDALGPAGEQLLERMLSEELGTPIDVADVPLPRAPVEAERQHGLQWLRLALNVLELADGIPGLYLCVQIPAPLPGPASDPDPAFDVARELEAAFRAAPNARVQVHGERWRLEIQESPCREIAHDTPPVAIDGMDAGPGP